jgi:ribosomal protein S18 acetylase RimI-like enzyme
MTTPPLSPSQLAGGFYGLLLGDAVGVPYEFHYPNNLPPLDQLDMIPPSDFPRAHRRVPTGTWSDDGALALALLDSLLDCGQFDAEDFGRRLIDWYEHGRYAVDQVVFDVGIQTAESIRFIKQKIPSLYAGVVVGTGCFFDGKNYDRLSLQTLRNMITFYGWREIVPVLLHTAHIGSVMKRPKKDELYLSNFGVAPACRSQGIGRAMIEQQIARAKQQGYRLFALDVAATNPRAQKLYESLGLHVICQKAFSGKRAGHNVPDARKMERIL